MRNPSTISMMMAIGPRVCDGATAVDRFRRYGTGDDEPDAMTTLLGSSRGVRVQYVNHTGGRGDWTCES